MSILFFRALLAHVGLFYMNVCLSHNEHQALNHHCLPPFSSSCGQTSTPPQNQQLVVTYPPICNQAVQQIALGQFRDIASFNVGSRCFLRALQIQDEKQSLCVWELDKDGSWQELAVPEIAKVIGPVSHITCNHESFIAIVAALSCESVQIILLHLQESSFVKVATIREVPLPLKHPEITILLEDVKNVGMFMCGTHCYLYATVTILTSNKHGATAYERACTPTQLLKVWRIDQCQGMLTDVSDDDYLRNKASICLQNSHQQPYADEYSYDQETLCCYTERFTYVYDGKTDQTGTLNVWTTLDDGENQLVLEQQMIDYAVPITCRNRLCAVAVAQFNQLNLYNLDQLTNNTCYSGQEDLLIDLPGASFTQFYQYISCNFPGGIDAFITLLTQGIITVPSDRLEELITAGKLTTDQSVILVTLSSGHSSHKKRYHLSSSALAQILIDDIIASYNASDTCCYAQVPLYLLLAQRNQNGTVIAAPEYVLALTDLERVLDALIPQDISKNCAFRIASLVKDLLLTPSLDGLRVYRWNTNISNDLASLVATMRIIDRLGIAFSITWWAAWLVDYDTDGSIPVTPSRALLDTLCHDTTLQHVVSQENFGSIIVALCSHLNPNLDLTTREDQALVACLITLQRQTNQDGGNGYTQNGTCPHYVLQRSCLLTELDQQTTVLTFFQMIQLLNTSSCSVPFDFFYTLLPLIWSARLTELEHDIERCKLLLATILPALDCNNGLLRDYYVRLMHTGLYQGSKNFLSFFSTLDSFFANYASRTKPVTSPCPLPPFGTTKILGVSQECNRKQLWLTLLQEYNHHCSSYDYNHEHVWTTALACGSPFITGADDVASLIGNNFFESNAQLALAFRNQGPITTLGIYPASDKDNGKTWFDTNNQTLRIDPGILCFEICSSNLLESSRFPCVWKRSINNSSDTTTLLVSMAQQIGVERLENVFPQLTTCCLPDHNCLGDPVTLGDSSAHELVRAQIEGSLLLDGGSCPCPQLHIKNHCPEKRHSCIDDHDPCNQDTCTLNNHVTIDRISHEGNCLCIKGWCWFDPACDELACAFAHCAPDAQGAYVKLHFASNVQPITLDPHDDRWYPCTFTTQPSLFIHPLFTLEQVRQANNS